jgi:hypothetical protein
VRRAPAGRVTGPEPDPPVAVGAGAATTKEDPCDR